MDDAVHFDLVSGTGDHEEEAREEGDGDGDDVFG